MILRNWNDERNDRVAESDYLQGIAADLDSTTEELVEPLIRSTYLGLPRVSQITFQELVSTGSLRMLRNAGLKRHLAEYYRDFDYLSQWYPEYRRKEAATEILLRGLLPLSARLDSSPAEIARAAENMDIQAVVESLRAQEHAVAILEDSVWTQQQVIIACDRLLSGAADLQALLQNAQPTLESFSGEHQ